MTTTPALNPEQTEAVASLLDALDRFILADCMPALDQPGHIGRAYLYLLSNTKRLPVSPPSEWQAPANTNNPEIKSAANGTKIDPDDTMPTWLANIVERSADEPLSIRAGWLLSAAKRVAGPAFIDLLAVELGGELAETRPRLSPDLAGLAEILMSLKK